VEPIVGRQRPGQGFAPWMRLHKGADFRAVFDNRCCSSEGWLAVHGLLNCSGFSRFGCSIGKRLVGNNCRRNRVRRLLREAVRLTRQQLPIGIDFVLTSRRGGIPSLTELMETLPKLAKQVAGRLEARAKRVALPKHEALPKPDLK
jgi:ribonuclease P protein component